MKDPSSLSSAKRVALALAVFLSPGAVVAASGGARKLKLKSAPDGSLKAA
jgi:hypothetical protein